MSAILVADTHFTDKPKDEYRWKLFDWLLAEKADEIVFCGDVTDAKDRHSANLVNRLIDRLSLLNSKFKVHILKGNHDYFDPDCPFFKFVNNMGIRFYCEPTESKLSIGSCYFMPANCEWNPAKIMSIKSDYLFTHVTFDNSISENGSLLPGINPNILSSYNGMCYSGDIHVPQKIRNNIEYIGAPYHVRFGDSFAARVILIPTQGQIDRPQDLTLPFPRKHVINASSLHDLSSAMVPARDFVKVRFYLHRRDFPKWQKCQKRIKEIAEDKKWVLCGIELHSREDEINDDTKKEYVSRSYTQLIEDYAAQCNVGKEFVDIGRMLVG